MAIFKKYLEEGIPQTQRYKYSDAVNIGNEPIIQKDIPMSVDSQTPTNNQFTRRTNDLGRIATLLTQKPGLKFIANRSALGTVDQDIKAYWETSKEPKEGSVKEAFGNKLKKLGNQALGGLANTGKILASTLAQVPVNGTGTHFVRGDKQGLGNMLEIFKGTQASTSKPIDTLQSNKIPTLTSNTDDVSPANDLIKFRFTILKPINDESNPIEYRYLTFKAFLDSFDDDYNGDWNSWKYNGRAENFYTYNGFERTVSIGFKAAAETKEELSPLYTKMVELASVTAPTYSEGGTMKGNFVKVTVGDYLANIPGIITNVSYSWNTSYPWDIAKQYSKNIDTPGFIDKETQQLPTVLDCSLSFTPIHSFVPQQGFAENQENYYITKKTENFDIAKNQQQGLSDQLIDSLRGFRF